MQPLNARNERIKHSYFEYLKEAEGYSEATIDAVAKALDRFETVTRRRAFSKFRREQAIAFKQHLDAQLNAKTGEPLSKSTACSTLCHLKRFIRWLAIQPGFKSLIDIADAEFFNPPRKDGRIASTRREVKAPTMEQIELVLKVMPAIKS